MNYKETAVSGQSYQRCNRVVIENRKGDVPSITFIEEEIVTVNGKDIVTPVGQFTKYFTPGGTFPLVSPMDNESLNADGSHVQLQVFLYSLYMAGAAERDAAATTVG